MSNNVIEFVIKALDGWSANLDKLHGDLSRMEKAFAALGLTAAAFTVIRMAEKSLENAEAAGVAAEKAGMLTEQYTALSWAAKLAEVEQGSLGAGLKFLNKTLAEGADGPGGKMLKELGIAATDTNGKLRPTLDVLFDLADKFKDGELGANKTTIAMTVLGRGGMEMVPMLNQGSAAIKEMMDNAEKLGMVISTDFAHAADNINDNLASLAATVKGSMNVAMAELAPTLETLSGNFVKLSLDTEAAKGAGESIAVALKMVATVVLGLGNLVVWAGDNFGAFAAAIVRAIHGDFKGAMDILSGSGPKLYDISNLWTDVGDAAAKAALATAKHARDMAKSITEVIAEKEAAIKADIDENATLNKLVADLQTAAETYGMTSGQVKLYTLALRGADDALVQEAYSQLNAASALEAHDKVRQSALDTIKQQKTPLEQHNDLIFSITQAYTEGSVTLAEWAQAITRAGEAWDVAKVSTLEYKRDAVEAMTVLHDLYQAESINIGSMAFQVGQAIKQSFDSLAKGVGNAVASALVDSENLAVGIRNVLRSVVKDMIATWVQMQIQRMIYAKMGASTDAKAATSHVMDSAGRVYAGTYADVAEHMTYGWIYGAAIAAAAAETATAGAMAYIGGGALAGAAHGGLDYVPAESTYLLDKGERVLSPNQNSDLTKFLQNGGGGGGGGVTIGSIVIHVLENATNAEVFSRMDKIQLRNTLGQPVIDALNEMFTLGIRPNFASQMK